MTSLSVHSHPRGRREERGEEAPAEGSPAGTKSSHGEVRRGRSSLNTDSEQLLLLLTADSVRHALL